MLKRTVQNATRPFFASAVRRRTATDKTTRRSCCSYPHSSLFSFIGRVSSQRRQQRAADQYLKRSLSSLAPETVINVDRYPIHQRESEAYADLVSDARRNLDTWGFFRLPGFLTEEGVTQAVEECEHIIDKGGIVNNQVGWAVNCFYCPPDESLPSTHPVNILQPRKFGAIRDDMLPESAVVRQVYDSQALIAFVADVTGEPTLYQSRDRYQALTVNVVDKDGDLMWHFDNNDCVVTLGVQMPESGGQLEFVPNIGRGNIDGIQQVLTGQYSPSGRITGGDEQVALDTLPGAQDKAEGSNKSLVEPKDEETIVSYQYDTEAGTLVFFRGGNSLHRVRPMKGDTLRLVAALQFHSSDDAFDSPEQIERIYSIPVEEHQGPKPVIMSSDGPVAWQAAK